jgi:hypothetical protein
VVRHASSVCENQAPVSRVAATFVTRARQQRILVTCPFRPLGAPTAVRYVQNCGGSNAWYRDDRLRAGPYRAAYPERVYCFFWLANRASAGAAHSGSQWSRGRPPSRPWVCASALSSPLILPSPRRRYAMKIAGHGTRLAAGLAAASFRHWPGLLRVRATDGGGPATAAGVSARQPPRSSPARFLRRGCLSE